MSKPRLWIALTRPDNLVNALAIAAVGREHFSACNLVYEASDWWEKASWGEFKPLFDEIHTVEKVPTCRGLRDVKRLYRALQKRQKALADLRLASNDTIVTLAGITALSNALASAYPRVHKILCITVKKYVDASRTYSYWRYRPTTSGWLQHRLLEPRAGLRPTIHLKPWWGGGDGIRLERLAEPLEEVFDSVLLLSNDGKEKPARAGSNTFPTRFPSLHDLGRLRIGGLQSPLGRQKVVFFGTPFLLVRNLPPDIYAARLNECLDSLRAWYAPECDLVYRPHPFETEETQKLRLSQFKIEPDGEVAELYFLRNDASIAAVFSVSSTVSRAALNFGLNAYALWRCFPFDASAAAYFESLMGQTFPEFEIASLAEKPSAYLRGRDSANGTTGFREVLGALFTTRSTGIVPARRSREKPFAAPMSSPV